MKYFILILLTLSRSALAVNPTSAPSVVLGGSGVDNIASLTLAEYSMGYSSPYFTIFAGGNTGTDGCAPFFRDGVQYQVTVGKVAQCVSETMSSSTTNSLAQTMLSTGTWTIAACPTANPQYQNGASGRYVYPMVAAYINYTRHDTIVFKSGSYPGVQYNTGAGNLIQFTALCRELP